MFRRLLLSFLFVCATHFLFAQDTIYKVNHDKVIAKVLEVNPEAVKFHLFSSPDGPLYIVEKSDIIKIVYADGHVEMFDEERSAKRQKHDEGSVKYPFLFSLNVFDFSFMLFTVNGEYYFRPERFSVKMALSRALPGGDNSWQGDDFFYYGNRKKGSAGVQLLFYPGHQQHTGNYFIGTAIEAGIDGNSDSYYGGGLVNGVLVKFSDRFNIGTDLVLGIERSTTSYRYQFYDDIRPLVRFEINMGVRFGK